LVEEGRGREKGFKVHRKCETETKKGWTKDLLPAGSKSVTSANEPPFEGERP